MKCIINLLTSAFFKFLIVATLVNATTSDERKTYIVYMGELPEIENRLTAIHQHQHSLLLDTIGDEETAKEAKLHTYGKSINGFTARLLPDEASKLAEHENVVSVFPNRMYKLHTTRSWDFLGMPLNVKRNDKVESNLIVGVIDTGITMDSESFDDKGYGPPPSRWKGKCEKKSANFTGCNNKVIGATCYYLGNNYIDDSSSMTMTPADNDGHGTHTASTAAGNHVPGANLYGIGSGTARGGAPSARVAVYKVCWVSECSAVDILAGFDAAIADGVDVLSISIGAMYSMDYFEDPIAIGAYHAMRKGILTVSSGGNNGPKLQTVENVAPWFFTVAATSTDRGIMTPVKLGSGSQISGISMNTVSPGKQMYSLINGLKAANTSFEGYGQPRKTSWRCILTKREKKKLYGSGCDDGTLSHTKVKGKVVFCLGALPYTDLMIKKLGGAGVIMSTGMKLESASPYIIPAALVQISDGTNIDRYINTSKTAKVVIYKSMTVNTTAPFVASFSSRGPQTVSKNILKPDIAAPGLNILAAFSPQATLSGYSEDKRRVKYNIMSGTSMACPHVTAAAIYVKSFHPTWSPAAIKSALMTTATPMKIKQIEDELGYGSGQINPTRAINPGLIYDINQSGYIRFLCKEGYNSTTIRLLTGGKKLHNCSMFGPPQGSDGLNYPSMQTTISDPNITVNAVFHRTVTNVGPAKSVYHAKVLTPKGLSVKVVPSTLSFNKKHEKRSFKVVLRGKYIDENDYLLSSMLEWSDGKHRVRSPIVVFRYSNW